MSTHLARRARENAKKIGKDVVETQREKLIAWLFAGKTWAAATLALFVALEFNLDRPGWAIATVFITSQPFAGATQSKAVYRLLGTLLGAAISVVLVPALVQAPVLLCVALATWVAVCLYLSLQDRSPRSYVFMLAGYSVAFISFPAVNTPLDIFDIAVSRVEEITLGVICSSCIHSIILPNSVMRAVWIRIDGWLRDSRVWSAHALRMESHHVNSMQSSFDIKVAGYPLELDALSRHLAFDTSPLRDEVPLLRALLYRLELLHPILASIEDRLDMFRQHGVEVPGAILTLINRIRGVLLADTAIPDLAALRGEMAAVEALEYQLDSWNDILRVGLVARLRELLHTLRVCYLLQQRLAAAQRRPTRRRRFRRLEVKRHIDQGFAQLSAWTAFISVLVGCVVWIETGWIDGATVPMIAAVACSFFATQDSPLPSMMKFAKFAFVAVAISLIYSTMLLPRATSFEIAALMLAPLFMWFGRLIATPSTSFIGMVVSTNAATLLGLNNVYVSDFGASLNAAIALLFGIFLTAVVMSVIRVRTPWWSAKRIMKAARTDLISTLRRALEGDGGRQAKEAFIHRMLDRLNLAMPRLNGTNIRGGIGEAALLPEIRLGANVLDLHRFRCHLPPAVNAEVISLTERIADFMQALGRCPDLEPSHELRYQLDGLLSTVANTVSTHRRFMLLALAGIRVVLFRDAESNEGPILGVNTA
ncbi:MULTISPECIES: FUSC family protein [unclassified Paraburkholderia]|uniref:FUSC family protein n=1 Tax=unclassified Paraburkholderia TaxID=2615204 RepID=UPI002AB2C3CF|nr:MULTISPECIES: FUSC family protein [unclassified Paraburkholderia]